MNVPLGADAIAEAVYIGLRDDRERGPTSAIMRLVERHAFRVRIASPWPPSPGRILSELSGQSVFLPYDAEPEKNFRIGSGYILARMRAVTPAEDRWILVC